MSRGRAAPLSPSVPLRFVLVRPRSPGNVGSAARAMKNFGFADLVLVDPRLHRAHDKEGEEPAFERESRQMAWGALDVLEGARRASSLAEALEGCGLVLGTAPQSLRGVPALSPEEAAERLAAEPEPPPALVFGSESSGLSLDEASRMAGVVVIPTHPSYRDLNLAQAVVLMAHFVFRQASPNRDKAAARAPHEEVEAVCDGLLDLTVKAEFLREACEPVGRELRALLHRAGLTPRETGHLRSLWRKIGRKLIR